MGTETKVGIVAGLVIVVIASVYFFYGSNGAEDELLVSAPTRVADSSPPGAGAQTPSSPGKVSEKPSLVRKSDRPAQPSQVARNTSRRMTPAQRPTGSGSNVGGLGADTAERRPVVTRPISAEPRTESTGPIVLADPASSKGRPALNRPVADQTDTRSSAAGRSTPSSTGASGTPLGKIGEQLRAAREASNALEPTELGTPPRKGPAADSSLAQAQPPSAAKTPPRLLARPGPAWDEPRPAESSPSQRARPRTHVIAEGDTLDAIAMRYYQDRSRAADILAANPGVKGPRNLKIGDALVLPALSTTISGAAGTVAQGAAARPGEIMSGSAADRLQQTDRIYVVQSGDTLYGIASRKLGNSARWEEILRINRDKLRGDPRRLAEGMTIRLPD